jgi:predicted DNA-binding transcriptional regulator AlpA
VELFKINITAKTNSTPTKHHHLDRRADKIVAADVGADDELLTTRQLANWLGVSTQFLEIGRSKKYGPQFVRVGPRYIVYRRGDVLTWLKERTHASTAEYAQPESAA